MNNIKHAAKIIHHMTGDLERAYYVARELNEAGLIVTDLPATSTPQNTTHTCPHALPCACQEVGGRS